MGVHSLSVFLMTAVALLLAPHAQPVTAAEEPALATGSSASENPGVREGGRPSHSLKEGGSGREPSVPYRGARAEALATWVWDAQVVAQPKSRDGLLAFCNSHRVDTLYLSAYNLQPPMDRAYREFNQRAHRQGLTVHALAGDPRWGIPRYHRLPLEWVAAVRQMNARSAPEERFDGIHSDVEVYLLSKSWEEKPAELLGGYLDLNAEMAQALRQDPKPLAFGVDIPFWFDDDPAYRIVWRGTPKMPSYHVLDTVDTATVMAYRNFAEGSDGTIELVRLEMDYADQVGKKVVIGQETQRDLFPAYVTFGGTSCGQFKREMKKIQAVVGHRPSFGGFAVHHYESYRELCRE